MSDKVKVRLEVTGRGSVEMEIPQEDFDELDGQLGKRPVPDYTWPAGIDISEMMNSMEFEIEDMEVIEEEDEEDAQTDNESELSEEE